MLDQSLNSKIIEEIFKQENRKGNIKKDFFPENYLERKIIIKEEKKELLKKEKDKKKNPEKKNPEEENPEEEYQKKIKLSELEEQDKENEYSLTEHWTNIANELNKKEIYSKLSIRKNNKEKKITFEADGVLTFFAFKWIMIILKKVFKCYPTNRYLILKDLKLLLNDDTSKWLIRSDISGFYESIPQDKILIKVCEKGLLTPHAEKIIRTTFFQFNQLQENGDRKIGIPRGLCFSAYLAEIYMKDVDTRIKNIPGVYYYARYVDDIVILIKPNKNGIQSTVDKIRKTFSEYCLTLKELNSEKMKAFDLTSKKEWTYSFNFLGYLIYMCNEKEVMRAQYLLSDNKLDRYKRFIDNILINYTIESKRSSKCKALPLMYDSLMYITKNFYLSGSKHNIKTGIYFNNNLLDNIEKLKELDEHLNKRVNDLLYLHPFKKLFNFDGCTYESYFMNIKQRITDNFSFEKGYNERLFCRIKPNRIKVIKNNLNLCKKE